jgi:hypothetical protein
MMVKTRDTTTEIASRQTGELRNVTAPSLGEGIPGTVEGIGG